MTGPILLAACLALPLPAPAAGQDPAAAQSEWERFSLLVPAGPHQPDPAAVRRLEPFVYAEHKVRLAERSLEAIAQAYGTDVASLQNANGEDLIFLPPGKGLKVFNKRGMLYEVQDGPGGGETLEDVVARISLDPETAEGLKERVVAANGLPGTALMHPFRLEKGRLLWIPGAYFGQETFRFPFKAQELAGMRMSSVFGNRYHPLLDTARFHKGLDFPKPWGTPVYPARSGRVTDANWIEGYGLSVIVVHPDGLETRYGHLSKILVKKGQWVIRDQTLLGRVGATGLATGPHLHFEVRDRAGNPLDPRKRIGR